MKTKLILNMTVFAATVLAAANLALADGVRSAGAKMLGDYGETGRASVYRSMPVYREGAPATGAAATRSFSVEPSRQPAVGSPCAPSAKPTAPPATAQRGATQQRSFSFEPAYPTSPRMYRRSESRAPAYLLPKSDSRKYGGF